MASDEMTTWPRANLIRAVGRARDERDEARQQRDELLEAIEAARYGWASVQDASVVALYDTAKKIRERTTDA